jgi:hypothetical protein
MRKNKNKLLYDFNYYKKRKVKENLHSRGSYSFTFL